MKVPRFRLVILLVLLGVFSGPLPIAYAAQHPEGCRGRRFGGHVHAARTVLHQRPPAARLS